MSAQSDEVEARQNLRTQRTVHAESKPRTLTADELRPEVEEMEQKLSRPREELPRYITDHIEALSEVSTAWLVGHENTSQDVFKYDASLASLRRKFLAVIRDEEAEWR